MKRAIIVHCWEGTPDYCWYPWAKKELEKAGYAVQVPAMPETDAPTEAKWVPELARLIGEPDEELVLIGHSIGTVAIMRYLETLPPGKKIGKAILVAGFTDDLGFKELNNFFAKPLDYEKIKNAAGKIIAIQSDDDPYVPMGHADILREKLGAEVVVKHAAGHMSGSIEGEKSCLQLTELLDIFNRKS